MGIALEAPNAEKLYRHRGGEYLRGSRGSTSLEKESHCAKHLSG